ncbi:MAG TPA: phosphatase PAP2 family protein [Puia sp.]|jgi:membrane-associated phospholipid phosphatase|nr:phosphatase PAP2 family protein [Puia sp.]
MKPFTLLLALFVICGRANAQTADTVRASFWDSTRLTPKLRPSAFILPAAMIAYGAIAVRNGTLQHANGEVKEGIWVNIPHRPFHMDNYLMFAPTFSVYALNAAGIHGKDNFKDRTMILLIANVIANGTVFGVKNWSHELRPNGSDYLSFPSGHTAEAFAGAEFMRMEYKDVSPWYGVAGYAMATMTGLLRMYNDAHWASDVIAGAGVGIASTRLAYWLYPKVQHLFSHKGGDPEHGTIIMPTYQGGSAGLVLVKRF